MGMAVKQERAALERVVVAAAAAAAVTAAVMEAAVEPAACLEWAQENRGRVCLRRCSVRVF